MKFKELVWKLLPEGRYAIYNEVKVPESSAPKKNFNFLPDKLSPNKPDYKWHYISFIRKYVENKERVVIIGGGRGVSSVVAARQAGSQGQVIIFEGSPEMFDRINNTLKINRVEEICQLQQKIVGPGIEVYTENETFEVKNPQDLDYCNVLFMDCQGAEMKILNKINFDPEKIIAEMHPYRYMKDSNRTIAPDEFIDELKNRDYSQFEFKHSKEKEENISEKRMRKLLKIKYRQKKGQRRAGIGTLSVFAKK